MAEASEFGWEGKSHCDYECLLAVGRELRGVRFRAIERYEIDTRIYH
jgi:hypothetical protein